MESSLSPISIVLITFAVLIIVGLVIALVYVIRKPHRIRVQRKQTEKTNSIVNSIKVHTKLEEDNLESRKLSRKLTNDLENTDFETN